MNLYELYILFHHVSGTPTNDTLNEASVIRGLCLFAAVVLIYFCYSFRFSQFKVRLLDTLISNRKLHSLSQACLSLYCY